MEQTNFNLLYNVLRKISKVGNSQQHDYEKRYLCISIDASNNIQLLMIPVNDCLLPSNEGVIDIFTGNTYKNSDAIPYIGDVMYQQTATGEQFKIEYSGITHLINYQNLDASTKMHGGDNVEHTMEKNNAKTDVENTNINPNATSQISETVKLTDYLIKTDEKTFYYNFQNKTWMQATWIENATSLEEVMDNLCANWSKVHELPDIEQLRAQWKLYIHQRIDVLKTLFDLHK